MSTEPKPPVEATLTVLLDQLWTGFYLATWHWRGEPAGHGVVADIQKCARSRRTIADVAICPPRATVAAANEAGQEFLPCYAGVRLAVASIGPAEPSAGGQVWLATPDAAPTVLPQRPTVSIGMWAAAGYACVLAGRPLVELASMVITAQPGGSSSRRRWSWPA